ncbi:MAG: ribosome silencing factor [Bacteroidales bacterium]
MVNKKQQSESHKLAKIIVAGIQEKKGKNIVSINLSKIANSVCNYFVICHGNSKVQVEAIADSVEEFVRKSNNDKAWQKEGFENAEWILLDYVDVVVHIFQENIRAFYNLEELWADAEIKKYKSDED